MPSPPEVNAFQQIIGRLAALAGDTAAQIMRDVAEEDQADVYAAAVDPHLNASSMISAEWYDSLSDKPFAAQPAPPADPETLRYKAGWAATEPDPPQALADATDRLVFAASRDTLTSNADREHVSYARYASVTACAWCSVLATRGAVYHSAEAAMASHDNCHCLPVPNRDSNPYREPDYVDRWREEYRAARKETGSKNFDDIVNAMRRSRRAAEKLAPQTV